MKLWIAVLLRQDFFNRSFQHTVLAAVAEALVVLAKFCRVIVVWEKKKIYLLALKAFSLQRFVCEAILSGRRDCRNNRYIGLGPRCQSNPSSHQERLVTMVMDYNTG